MTVKFVIQWTMEWKFCFHLGVRRQCFPCHLFPWDRCVSSPLLWNCFRKDITPGPTSITDAEFLSLYLIKYAPTFAERKWSAISALICGLESVAFFWPSIVPMSYNFANSDQNLSKDSQQLYMPRQRVGEKIFIKIVTLLLFPHFFSLTSQLQNIWSY